MTYTQLGRTGMTVSSLCFGTMSFGREADEAASRRMFAQCLEAGINFFDCADIYADGEAERILGRLCASHRDDLILTSKVGMNVGPHRNDGGLSRRHILRQIDGSLRRMGLEWLDLYFCHRFDPTVEMADVLETMHDLVRSGKIRSYGLSNWTAWQTAKALGICEKRGLTPPQVLQPMYSLAKRTAEVEIFPLARSEGLGVIPYSPLGGGILTGKYLVAGGAPKSRLCIQENYARRYENEVYSQIARRFAEYADQVGLDRVTLAIAWVKAHPAVTAPILGARNSDQLAPALRAADFEMSPEQWREIAALTPSPPVATDRDEERVDPFEE